jgi:predicted porin
VPAQVVPPFERGVVTDKGPWLFAAALAAALVVAPADAWAQPAPAAPNVAQRTIDCSAGEGSRTTCAADTSAGVVLTAQAGSANCVLGTTWGYDAQGVWVADGCRGTFAFTDDRPAVTCAAAAGAREVCEANTADGVSLVTGSPACVLGRTWGYDEEGIWVSDGCQATFVLTTRSGLTCGSDGGRQHCAADTSAGVVLARSTAAVACVLGQTWGYDAAGVWVDKGCRAEFVLGDVDPGGEEDRDLDAFFGLFNPYGRFLGHAAFFNDEIEVQDNLSWLGLDFSTRGPVKLFAATEWGVNLVRGGIEFNPSANGDTGFPELNDAQADQVFYNRLGYVGVDVGPFGRIAVGKQWGVHTDVSLYTTDQFNVFGSEASATYTAGTDGGTLGTGRADQAITYRNNLFNIFRVGGQLQFRTADNGEVIDGYGVSAQLTLLPGARIGATYTRANYADDVKARIPGLDGDGEFAAVGARMDWHVVEAGLVFSRQRNGDLARLVLSDDRQEAVGFDADGVEAILRINIPGFAPYGGLIYYRPNDSVLVADDFRTRYLIAGAEVGITGSTFAYVEARLFDDSIGPQGEETGFDVLTIGVHYGFSFRGFHRKLQ